MNNLNLVVESPGRINLIGEHVDYNGGFVLPAAIDKKIILSLLFKKFFNFDFVLMGIIYFIFRNLIFVKYFKFIVIIYYKKHNIIITQRFVI